MRVAPWLVSGLFHAVALAALGVSATAPAPGDPARAGWSPPLRALADRAERPARARARRVELLEEARQKRAAGQLELGSFLLRANAIDAAEQGDEVDLERASTLFQERVTLLRAAMKTETASFAVAHVFDDIAYTGTPGGRLSEVLFDKRGSCEPVSHLLSAALYDAGLRDEARLRFYGAPSSGATHLAPVLLLDQRTGGRVTKVEMDLTRGRASEPGGVSFPASDLVEAYARVHGLAPRPPKLSTPDGDRDQALSGDDNTLMGDDNTTKTMTGGYPPNADRFAGALPLYADRAVLPPAAASSVNAIPSGLGPPPCTVHVHMAWLDAPKAIAEGRTPTRVDLVRQPSALELEALSTTILSVESRRSKELLAERLLEHACLVALYDRAGLLFSLANQGAVSRRAMKSARRERLAANAALSELGALPPKSRAELERALFDLSFGRIWVLMFLEGGADLVLSLAAGPNASFWRTVSISALLVSPETRARAVALADTLPIETQIDVMHELMHAHDNARPWAATYALDLSAWPGLEKTNFARKNRVFSALAWRLWDGAQPPEDTVIALVKEGAREELDAAALRTISEYYMTSYFRLMSSRERGPWLIERASAALEAHGFVGKSGLSAAELEGRVPRPKMALPAPAP